MQTTVNFSELKILDKTNKNDFLEIYKILEESFSDDTRRDLKGQEELLKSPYYKILVAKNGAETEGFLCVWEFEDFLYLEHFAVKSTLRNSGKGTMLLKMLFDYTDMPLCLEAEHPNTPIDERRINFYERNGFLVNDYPYIQPKMGLGKKEVPLLILTHPKKITLEEFNQYKKRIYKEVYKVI